MNRPRIAGLVALSLLLSLSGSVPATAQKLDYSDLVFPRDAKGVVEDEEYLDDIEQIDDPVEASIRRLYSVSMMSRLSEGCPEGDFLENLSRLGLKGRRFFYELRADNDLEDAFPRSKYVPATLMMGALEAGRRDADALIEQGACANRKN